MRVNGPITGRWEATKHGCGRRLRWRPVGAFHGFTRCAGDGLAGATHFDIGICGDGCAGGDDGGAQHISGELPPMAASVLETPSALPAAVATAPAVVIKRSAVNCRSGDYGQREQRNFEVMAVRSSRGVMQLGSTAHGFAAAMMSVPGRRRW